MWAPPFPPEEFDGYDDEAGMETQVLTIDSRTPGLTFSALLVVIVGIGIGVGVGVGVGIGIVIILFSIYSFFLDSFFTRFHPYSYSCSCSYFRVCVYPFCSGPF